MLYTVMDIEEKVTISLLLDYYGKLLNKSQYNMLKMRYDDDLSLMEIAQRENISRQGVRDAILRGIKALYEYEDKLKLKVKFDKLREQLHSLKDKNKQLDKEIDLILKGIEEN